MGARGGKNTKFFLSLEKQRSNSNTIFSLKDQKGTILNKSDNILNNIRNHFEMIYKENNPLEDDAADDFVKIDSTSFLDEGDEIILNHELTESDILYALKKSNNKAAPGLDGLPGEIYKLFWKDIKDPLLESFNYSFELGKLSNSQTKGVICLHHKGKGLDREILSNWRPISLINFDYKLLAKVMASRLNSCIFKCFGEDQFAFIKGRQVGDLLREIDDILTIGKLKFPESIILSIDYAKAFDTISLKAVKKALVYFGFSGTFIKWIDLLLSDRKSCVQNGGYLSDFFKMERGVRQGCPISPLLFILTLELLARDIRQNENIKGLQINFGENRPVKIKLYADDATLFLRDMMDYREVLSRIKSFSLFSGLCLNKQKSIAMVIGNTNYKNFVKFGIKFSNKVKILGIIFSNECEASDIKENYEAKIDKLERLCSLWGKRYLTLHGRITILKSFGISLFIYLMQSIGIKDEYLKKINTIIFRFIWNPSAKNGQRVTEKVKREIICKSYENGGLNMINIFKMQDSFLLKLGDRILNDQENSWKNIPKIYFNKIGGISAFKSDLVCSEFKGLDLIENVFWKNVLSTWLKYKNVENDASKRVPSIHDPLFNNSLIKFRKNVLFNLRCIDKKLIYIKDVLKQGEILPFKEFDSIFNKSADSLLIYNIISNALKPFELQLKNDYDSILSADVEVRESQSCFFKDLETGEIDRRVFYDLIQNKITESVRQEWRDLYLLSENDPDIWCLARDCCDETKLLELQWKILHYIYPTGTLLHKMKIRNNDLCSFCDEIDSMSHFFVSCHIARAVWEDAEKSVSKICGKKVTLSERNKLFGILLSDNFDFNNRKLVNKVILVCKHTISKYKFEKIGSVKLMLEHQLSFRGLYN